VSKVVRHDTRFIEVQKLLQEAVATDFVRAYAYAQEFEMYRVIHFFGQHFNFDAYAERQQEGTSFKETVQAFKTDMGQIKKWVIDLEKMKTSGTERNLHVDTKTLKNGLMPICQETLNKCRTLLLSVAREFCAEALASYQMRIRDLSEQPRSLRDFADYCDNLNRIRIERNDMEDRAMQVNEMYDLLEMYEVKVPAADAVKKDDLKEARDKLTEQTGSADGAVGEKMEQMVATLNKSIANLNEDLVSIMASLSTGDYVDPTVDPKVVLERLHATKEQMAAIAEKAEGYKAMQETFKQPPQEFKQLNDTMGQYELRMELWSKLDTWNEMLYAWKAVDFKALNVEELIKEVAQNYKDAHKLSKRPGPNGLPDPVVTMFKESVEDFKEQMPCIQDLANLAVVGKDRHWAKLYDKLGQSYYPGAPFTLEQLLSYGATKQAEFINETSNNASGEFGLEQLLEKIRKGWADIGFVTLNHRDQADIFIVGGIDEVVVQLEDSQVGLQTILASRFVGGIRTEVEEWEKKLSTLSEVLDEWLTCQRSWMYLENIFGAEDIQKQLPAESQKFTKINKFFIDRMRKCHDNPNVIAQVTVPGLLDTFLDANKQLDEIQKSLNDYLELKCAAFPRFYFLSNDELLEILSQTRDPYAVQPHLIKCFDAIKRLQFGDMEDAKKMLAIISGEAEVVPFVNCPMAEGPVEVWLMNMQLAMIEALYTNCKNAWLRLLEIEFVLPDKFSEARMGAENGPLDQWFFGFPAQSIIMIGQIEWTLGVDMALTQIHDEGKPDALKIYSEKWIQSIGYMVSIVRRQLKPNQRQVIGAKLTLDVHCRDTNSELVHKKVGWVNEFEWQKQLRYQWDEEVDDCALRQTNTYFRYGYEYLGNSMRLVVTPLTDKCYMTLTGGLNLGMGGAPAGPAGTGKTETTKDLAKALARQCVVMNCGPDLTVPTMGRFFSGLAQSGAWACFDEFNRIDIEVLSVIAQQVLTIMEAVKMKVERFIFEGREISLNPGYGVFITMNPGYAGRAELPDNLKALFRPVAMMIPDYRLIAEIMLFSEGFGEAKPLSTKMTKLYQLSSEQLSKQDHYDFGMRAVKSVLVMAGGLKRENPQIAEDITLIRALRDSNVPKFLYHDLPLFVAIIQDLFPGVTIPNVDYGTLQKAIERQITLNGMQPVPSYVAKVIQLFETMLVRHGVMVVGLTLTGKTMNTNMLAAALSQLKRDGDESPKYEVTKQHWLNPKSITMGELYGEVNTVTQEWSDGIVPYLVRLCVTDESENKNWVVFDGPVDALWIENMNTVLDDNKMLCLSNGERIKLAKTQHMMFEVNDLSVASPATVSRCGMVYMEYVYIGTEPYIKSWVENVLPKRLPQHGARLSKLLTKYSLKAIDFVREECKVGMPAPDPQIVRSMFNLLDATLLPKYGVSPGKSGLENMINLWFIWCFIWAIGGNLQDASRARFDKYVRECGILKELDPTFPTEGTVYDYCVSPDNGAFVSWASQTASFTYQKGMPYFGILVPTGETTCFEFLLKVLVDNSTNVMMVGETGTGKSVLVQGFLSRLPQQSPAPGSPGFTSIQAAFSAQTAAKNMQDLLESKLDKLRKNLLGAPPGRQNVIFVDDINMPALEKYGAQPPIELVRQTLAQGGFYDLKKLFFKKVQNTSFLAACGPAGGGRNAMTPRLTRHFNLLWIPTLSSASMQRIFTSILGGFLTASSFPLNITELGEPVVRATIHIYNRMLAEMLPTPSKSHYTFNLRDVSRVMQGALQITPAKAPDPDAFLRLWAHETCRVFCDRLISDKDRTWFRHEIVESVKTTFSKEWDTDSISKFVFGSFMNTSNGVAGMVYEELDVKKSGDKFAECLSDYNMNTTKPMNLVFFTDATLHLARISRVITQPRGCALLVGVGGSGRSSLARLAASMWEMKCLGIEITRTYDFNAWHDDLKTFMFAAGCENKPTVFLFSDTQIIKEAMVEDINGILNSGEVPNLFAEEDMQRILSACRPLAKEAGKGEGRDDIYKHFISLVRENLHIVMCVSPIGDAFRVRCRMFPSLINCCTIDWFDAWPKDALLAVANRYFEKVDMGSPETKAAICNICVEIHYSVGQAGDDFFAQLRRKTYTTPTSYLELLNLYSTMLGEQKSLVARKISHYSGGVNKLIETNAVVDTMKDELTKLQPVLVQAAKDTTKLLEEVSVDQANADEVKQRVAKEEAAVGEVAKEAQAIAADAKRDLDEAMPAFYASVDALKSLNKNDINEVKAYKQPPELVVLTLEAVCILLGVKPDWGEAKKLMSAMDFLEQLQNYDKDNIEEKKIKNIQKYMKNEKFLPEMVGKVSTAAKSLCMWVRAMDTYARVAKTVEPKKAKLLAAQKQLADSQAMLKEKQDALKEVERRVAGLKKKLDDTQRKAKQLEEQEADTKVKLERADKLVGGLGSEKTRWEQLCVRLNQGQRNVVGNTIVCAGAIAYEGPFTAKYRNALNSQWISKVKELDVLVEETPAVGTPVTAILGDPVTIREWGIAGLPQDNLSIENAIFVTRSRRWPLMIDPQSQANRWIKNLEKDNKLRIIKLSQSDFLRTLESSIRVGVPVLLENVQEALDPSLDPVLLKQVYKSQGRMLLRLGDTDVDYSENFKFYITSPLANPHYAPEVCIKVTIVNFTVTIEGLEDQLLADVASLERPDLQQKKEELVISIAAGRKTIQELEDTILRLLAESSGNILDDEALINTLDSSKKISKKTEESVKGAEVTTKEIVQTCEAYRPVATRGSILYFVVADFRVIDPMYQFSLQYFKQVFCKTVTDAPPSDDLAVRLQTLLDEILKSIFVNICRALFEKHKTLFAFLIAVGVLRQRGDITPAEWAYFLKAGIGVDGLPDAGAASSWIEPRAWAMVLAADAEIDELKGLRKSVMADSAAWETFFTSETPETAPLPAAWEKKATAFHRLLLVKAFRPEKVAFGSSEFVGNSIGKSFKEPPPFDLQSTYNDSSSKVPIVFVLTSGADPTQYLLALGRKYDYSVGDNLKMVSLGQGQGPIAERLMAEGQGKGYWVCLQNCHLAVSWLPTLDRLLEQLRDASGIAEDFRMWLTTMPTPEFPSTILQNSLKLTQEPPKGLKANIGRSYIDMDVSTLEGCAQPTEFKNLLFGLCFFNAVIQERRKYGAIGWNIAYQWMTSDLNFAQANLKLFLDQNPSVPWEALNIIISDVIYGGRVTDKQDVRLTRAILSSYLDPQTIAQPTTFSYCPQLDAKFRYCAPPEGPIDTYRQFISTFPLVDRPEIFGLHLNADITFQTKESAGMLETIISLQPRTGGGGGGKSSDEVVGEVCDDLVARMPKSLNLKEAGASTFAKLEDGSMNPLGIFLSQEIDKFNRMIGAIKTMLNELQRGLKGLVVMSAQLDAAYANLLFQQVPGPWGEGGKGYPSLKPLASWYKDFVGRVEFMRGWLTGGPPKSFWISAVFFPQGFFTSALQAYARKYKEAIDLLEFVAFVKPYAGLEDVPAAPPDGVFIHGMFMEGARFDPKEGCMAESHQGELFAPMNVLHLMPDKIGPDRAKGNYECPFYKTNVRAGTLSTTGHSTNHVCNFWLKSKEDPLLWTRRGTALISMTND
jgi:dynein heavy chain, axonemal